MAARGRARLTVAKNQRAHAHALDILLVKRMCDIEFSEGRVTKKRSGTHAP
jgi:hypothetical protein